MLTDTKLRNLKPRDKLYKVNDREGLYVAVTPAGSISFRYNYSINGRQETITFGRYGVGGITLAEAREQLNDAKKMVAAGKSPAKEKARDKARVKDAETFGAWAEKWLRGYQMADSTRDMRRSVYERELKPKFSNQKLVEITHEDLRALTDAIVERGAPATAVHVREIVMQVFRWATERGQKVENPAELVRPTSIARFEPRDRALTPDEIALMYQYMERVGIADDLVLGFDGLVVGHQFKTSKFPSTFTVGTLFTGANGLLKPLVHAWQCLRKNNPGSRVEIRLVVNDFPSTTDKPGDGSPPHSAAFLEEFQQHANRSLEDWCTSEWSQLIDHLRREASLSDGDFEQFLHSLRVVCAAAADFIQSHKLNAEQARQASEIASVLPKLVADIC